MVQKLLLKKLDFHIQLISRKDGQDIIFYQKCIYIINVLYALKYVFLFCLIVVVHVSLYCDGLYVDVIHHSNSQSICRRLIKRRCDRYFQVCTNMVR